MKQRIKLGVVCLARETYDVAAAAGLYEKIRADLLKLEEVDLEMVPELVISIDDAKKSARLMAEAHVDGFVCISGTFHLGHLVLEFNKQLQVPILHWGLDELPYNGGKIRLNSVCGINLDASNLYKAGVNNYKAFVGQKIDKNWVDAIRVLVSPPDCPMSGLLGYRANGFFNLSLDDSSLYGTTGILIDHYELSDVYTMSVESSEIARREGQIRSIFDVSGLDAGQVTKVAELSAKLAAFYKTNMLSAVAVRCWPEFARDFGIAPCAAMSLLQSEGMILACEGDLEGALSMIAHQAMGAETPYLFDFSQFDFGKNFALLWHDGVAPCNLWDGHSLCSLDSYFAGGKGVTADFVLKPGEISIARIDTARGKRRLFLQKATGVPMEKELKGTYLKVVFNRPVKEVLDLVLKNGIAHHASMVYGDYIQPLKVAADIMGWEVIE